MEFPPAIHHGFATKALAPSDYAPVGDESLVGEIGAVVPKTSNGSTSKVLAIKDAVDPGPAPLEDEARLDVGLADQMYAIGDADDTSLEVEAAEFQDSAPALSAASLKTLDTPCIDEAVSDLI
eukprot:6462103-Pyramimonas_sp.AAC.1